MPKLKSLTMVYLSSPYSNHSREVIQKRSEEALRATIWGWKQGYLVFSPIVYTHMIAVSTPQIDQYWRWIEFDMRLLRACDELWVLKLDGWEDSRGVNTEIAEATHLKIPIRYIDPTEIPPDELASFHELVSKMYAWVNSKENMYG